MDFHKKIQIFQRTVMYKWGPLRRARCGGELILATVFCIPEDSGDEAPAQPGPANPIRYFFPPKKSIFFRHFFGGGRKKMFFLRYRPHEHNDSRKLLWCTGAVQKLSRLSNSSKASVECCCLSEAFETFKILESFGGVPANPGRYFFPPKKSFFPAQKTFFRRTKILFFRDF